MCGVRAGFSRPELAGWQPTLPARNDIESEDPIALWTLERLGVINLDRNVAEQHAQARADADDRHAITAVPLEPDLRFVGRVPSHPGIRESEQLGRDEAGQQTVLL